MHRTFQTFGGFRAVIKCSLAILVLVAFTGLADEPPRPFLHPDRIRYDQQCLTIDGKDVFIYSGAFHYFRCPKELWHDRFQKIKDAGFNCVETYVAWNWCERQMPSGLNDFSQVQLADLDDFLSMAEQFGLYVIVRPGPYICAEWDGGGYPQWLMTKKPANERDGVAWLRSNDPVYLAWCKHWYDAVCPVIAKHQITRRPAGKTGVILVQLENEYDYAHFSDQVKLDQVLALGEAARADGIEVPFITCWTHPVRGQSDPLFRQIFDCCNFYPRWDVDGIQKDIDKLRKEQPDAPLATTELQGGWFSKVGEKLSEDQEGITDTQINNLTLFAIQNGETLLNYYMLFGGTNPGDWAARDLTTTYDYNAPIREWGGVGPRYQRVWALGHMLQTHGVALARSQAVKCTVTVPQNDVTVVLRRAADGGRYLFVRTSQHEAPRQGTAHVTPVEGADNQEIVFDYQLEPFGSKVLYLPPGVNDPARGEWLPRSAPAIDRPTDVPSPVVITSALSREDSGPSHWTPLKPGEDLARAGIYDSDFICYQTEISVPATTNLWVGFPDGDAVVATVNNRMAEQTDRGHSSSVFALPAGDDQIRLLYENHGHANGGSAMEQSCGLTGAKFTSGAGREARALDSWRMQVVDNLNHRPETGASFDDHDWTTVSAASPGGGQLTPNQAAVFRVGVELAADDLKEVRQILTFARIDDLGWVYVNGRLVGKTTDWSQAYSFDITKHLHPGHNLIAVAVQNIAAEGGIGQPTLTAEFDGASVKLQSFGRTQGNEQQWWAPDLADAGWKTVKLGAASAASPADSLLVWYRLNFALPAVHADLWVPWRLHLTGSGNGFLYLNGHALGRYWQAGPQHDFFLPECWLKFGDGQTNNLTLNLRPVNGHAAIQSAIVEPYSTFAERR